jgi:hypothetical protein
MIDSGTEDDPSYGRDKNGNVLPHEATSASGAGTRNRVVTFVCAFKHRHEDIEALVIEERVQR